MAVSARAMRPSARLAAKKPNDAVTQTDEP
jgi:hypothetical protein